VDDAWHYFAACAGLVVLLPPLGRLRRAVRGTALETAWRPLFSAWLTWLVISLLSLPSSPLHRWSDVGWYLAAVVALVPPIAVLGARRPTSHVWTWFVLVPLVLVFVWPVAPVLRQTDRAAAFTLEEPVLVGYVLVLIMGGGNYLGLKYSISSLLWMCALLLVVLPLCPATVGLVPAASICRVAAVCCLVAAAWIADRQAAGRKRSAGDSTSSLDRAWDDFRELFGIVWSRRTLERFNDYARQKALTIRLVLHGFEDAAGKPLNFDSDPAIRAAAEAALRWHLQKFVDPEWMDVRLRVPEGQRPGQQT
jgi:hypothetical protein